jgi:hypothetical protein
MRNGRGADERRAAAGVLNNFAGTGKFACNHSGGNYMTFLHYLLMFAALFLLALAVFYAGYFIGCRYASRRAASDIQRIRGNARSYPEKTESADSTGSSGNL